MYSFAAEYEFIWLLEMYSITKNIYSLNIWMGLLNTYSVETEYVFSCNWIWQNHMFSLHVGRIQLQLNTYSVAAEYVFSCLLGSYSFAYLGCMQLQLTSIHLQLNPVFLMTCLLRTRYGNACIVSYGHVNNLNSPSPSPLPLLPPLLLLMLISHIAISPNPKQTKSQNPYI